jgi:hypothetical protein
VPGNTKGDLISLATDADRTLYFDFLPINIGTINGFTTRFQLYTVPGQVFYNATRKLVLRGVDGLIFVADSQRDKADENVESLTNLKENLAEYGYDLDSLPLILQYNKRDLPEIMTIEELNALLNEKNWPYFESIAHKGKGVFDTLKLIIKLILENAKKSKAAQKIEEAQRNPQAVVRDDEGPAVEPIAATTQAQRSQPTPAEIDPNRTPIGGTPIPGFKPGQQEWSEPAPSKVAASLESKPATAAVLEAGASVPMPASPTTGKRSPEEKVVGIQTNQEFNPEPEDAFEENTLAESQEDGSALPESPETISAGEETDAAAKTDRQFVDIDAIQFQPKRQEMDRDSSSVATEAEETGQEDPFALPSNAPKMAAPTRLKARKKGFFLSRWLFGRK